MNKIYYGFTTVFIVVFVAIFLLSASFSAKLSAEDGLFPFSVGAESLGRLWLPPGEFSEAGKNGQIRVQGDIFVDETGKQVRFWGTNLSFDSNFPEKADAERFARRLRTFGINCIRLHFVDTRIWGKYEKEFGHRRMDEEQLDRLDWFIFQLKRCGIYVNINLHVGRTLDMRDGNFPEAERLPNMQKGVDNFMPEMIELQKEYARNLLTHVNPYTKMAYTEDPCVAFIEINNENSAVCEWWNMRDLPDFYRVELEKRWNAWLKKRYSSTEELQTAWGGFNEPMGVEMIPDGSFTSAKTFQESPWKLETDERSAGTVECDEKSQTLRIHATKPAPNNWNPQFYLYRGKVEEGKPYVVKFRIRSSVPKRITFYFMENHDPWRYISRYVEVEKEWKEIEMLLQPEFSDDNVRFGFAQLAGEVEVDDFSVRRGGFMGLTEGESLENGTIRAVFTTTETATYKQKCDFHRFLIDLEGEYWREMYSYVRDELHARAPITGTQIRYGSAYAQAEMDFCDIHNYWCHPYWPNREWDYNDWVVQNDCFVNSLPWKQFTPSLAPLRIIGKPYTLSEFNQPNPNFYAAEAFPITACVGAFQNWSAIYSYCWSHTKKHEHTNIFFDICHNSQHLVHHPACVNLFVRGDVQRVDSLPTPPVEITEMSRELEQEVTLHSMGWYHRDYTRLGQSFGSALTSYCGIRLPDLKLPHVLTDSVTALNSAPDWVYDPKVHRVGYVKTLESPTQELFWNGERPEKAYFMADTERTKIFTGFIDGRTFRFKDGTILEPGETLLDWATISLTEVDSSTEKAKNSEKNSEKSGEKNGIKKEVSRWLLSATGLAKYTGETFRPYDEPERENVTEYRELEGKRLFSPKRGKAPQRCEGIPFRLVLPIPAGATVSVYPLDGNAVRMPENAENTENVTIQYLSETEVEIRVSGKSETLWYEIEIEK